MKKGLEQRLKYEFDHLKENHGELNFSCLGLNEDDVKIICESIRSFPAMIQKLNLRSNNIFANGAEYLKELKNVKELNICENHLRDEGVKILLKNTYFEELSIFENGTSKELALLLSKVAHQYKTRCFDRSDISLKSEKKESNQNRSYLSSFFSCSWLAFFSHTKEAQPSKHIKTLSDLDERNDKITDWSPNVLE